MEEDNEIWKIYKESFPENQRRNVQNQKRIQKNPLYKLQPIYLKDKIIAFIALWEFQNFIFVEHFAVKKEFRGKGYGTKILKETIQKYSKKIILETEKPDTFLAEKRIKFYENLKFNINKYEYYQPAYNENTESVELYIMSYPSEINQVEFEEIREKLYNAVYEYKTQ